MVFGRNSNSMGSNLQNEEFDLTIVTSVFYKNVIRFQKDLSTKIRISLIIMFFNKQI